MDKLREKMLEEFKKATLKEREKMAKKYEFDTPELLLANLVEGVYGVVGTDPLKREVVTDVVIAFDTTGSMSSYIDAVKLRVKVMIPEMFRNIPNLKMKIVAFGDYCDMKSKHEFGKAYQESAMTHDENVLIDFVSKAQNTSGGDGDEFYELVIKKVTEETPWRDGKKLFILIADCEPHQVGYSFNDHVVNNQIDWKEEAKKARDKGIQIDTFKILSYTWYDELSAMTNGVCLPFKTANKTVETVMASTYARSNTVKFRSAQSDAVTRGDTEMIGVYKSLSSKLDETKGE